MPTEGSPLIIVPSGIFRGAPNPNAARLFQSFLLSAETQQMLVDDYAHRSFHAQVKEKPGHVPLSEIKLLKAPTRRGAGAERSDQGALFEDFRGVMRVIALWAAQLNVIAMKRSNPLRR